MDYDYVIVGAGSAGAVLAARLSAVPAVQLGLVEAGLDSVMNAMAFGMRHLADDRQLQASLRADPSLIVPATEELLRLYTFTCPGRLIMRDAVYHGVELIRGLTTGILDWGMLGNAGYLIAFAAIGLTVAGRRMTTLLYT